MSNDWEYQAIYECRNAKTGLAGKEEIYVTAGKGHKPDEELKSDFHELVAAGQIPGDPYWDPWVVTQVKPKDDCCLYVLYPHDNNRRVSCLEDHVEIRHTANWLEPNQVVEYNDIHAAGTLYYFSA